MEINVFTYVSTCMYWHKHLYLTHLPKTILFAIVFEWMISIVEVEKRYKNKFKLCVNVIPVTINVAICTLLHKRTHTKSFTYTPTHANAKALHTSTTVK